LAWFLLGEVYFSLERYSESSDAYAQYIKLRPGVLDGYVQTKIGDSFFRIGDNENALKAFSLSEQAIDQLNPSQIEIKIAQTLLASGKQDETLKILDNLSSSADNDYLKAQLDLLYGQTQLAMGNNIEGYGYWRHAVENYPLAYDSYSALVGLVEAGQPVDEFSRGLVDYFAQKYDVALAAFQRFSSANPNHDGTVLHYMALTLREMGDYSSAVQLWSNLIDQYPGNRFWASAWDERATTQWIYLDDYTAAARGLENFAAETIGSPYTTTYLMDAARIYERSGDLGKAATIWESIQSRSGDQAEITTEAWFQAGISRYRLAEFQQANNDFQQSLLLSKSAPDRARALIWIGKSIAAAGDKKLAISYWEQAQISDPDGYYGIRGADLIAFREPFLSPPSLHLEYDLTKERLEAAAWLRIKFNLPETTDLSSPGSLEKDPYLLRGTEYWNLGLFNEARAQFEILRENNKANLINSFCLGNYLLDIGMYRSGIYALRDVLNLAGLDNQTASLSAPAYFSHVRYGLYYSDLIWNAAQETTLDPLFITSVIRQESLFEGFVFSSQGARGLMQIIPSTGESIAAQMGWPTNFTADDLYSPYISIRLGSQYLLSNRRYLNNDPYAMLAAYNGGPGNAAIWQDLAKGDLDLELEIIRYGETRDYIRSIYEIYVTYRHLYSPMK
jgi:soluble lytic murein transglycosylase